MQSATFRSTTGSGMTRSIDDFSTPRALYTETPVLANLSYATWEFFDFSHRMYEFCPLEADFDSFLDMPLLTTNVTSLTSPEDKNMYRWNGGHVVQFLTQFPKWKELLATHEHHNQQDMKALSLGEILCMYMIAGPANFEKGPDAVRNELYVQVDGESTNIIKPSALTLLVAYSKPRLLRFLTGRDAKTTYLHPSSRGDRHDAIQNRGGAGQTGGGGRCATLSGSTDVPDSRDPGRPAAASFLRGDTAGTAPVPQGDDDGVSIRRAPGPIRAGALDGPRAGDPGSVSLQETSGEPGIHARRSGLCSTTSIR